MSAGVATVTAEDLLSMPDDGVERWIVNGELREGGMTIRSTWHTDATSNVDFALRLWLRTQPRPRGRVHVGDAGVRLRHDPELTLGVDLVYLSPTLAARTPIGASIIDGAPTLAIEILSPYDKHVDVEEKIDSYLEAGVPQVWAINPKRRTVTVYRPNMRPLMFNDGQELSGEPELPGFIVPVLSFFEDTAP